MAMKVSLSFKENEKDLYNHLMKQLSSSIYIKQLIKNEMEPKIPKTQSRSVLDF